MDENSKTEMPKESSTPNVVDAAKQPQLTPAAAAPAMKSLSVVILSLILVVAVGAIFYFANNPIGQDSRDHDNNLSETDDDSDADADADEDTTEDADTEDDESTDDTDEDDGNFVTETIVVGNYNVTVTYNEEYELIESNRTAPISRNDMETAEITLKLADTTGNKTELRTTSLIIISPEIYFESYDLLPQEPSSSAIPELFIGTTRYVPVYYALGEGFGGSMFYAGTDSIKVYNDLYVAVKSYRSTAEPWCEEPALECSEEEFTYATTEVELENAKEIVKKLEIVAR